MKTDPTEGRHGLNFFIALSLAALLSVLFIQWDLFVLSIRTFLFALALFISAPQALQQIFTSEITQFWAAAFYLLTSILILSTILFRRMKRKAGESPGTPGELSLGKISLRAFMRQKIALIASAIIFILYSVAFLAPYIAPFSPYDQQDFLVTAYQPPLTRIEGLLLKQPKTLEIPMQKGEGSAIWMVNTLIGDFRKLKTRNEPHAIRFVNSVHEEGESAVYRQGMRTKTIPLEELQDRSTGSRELLFSAPTSTAATFSPE